MPDDGISLNKLTMPLVVKRKTLADGKPRDVEYRLNFPYDIIQNPTTVVVRKFYPHFEPTQTNRFTIDTMNELRLEDIVGLELRMGVDPLAKFPLPHGKVWRPIRVNLEINGRPVFDRLFNNVQVGPLGKLDLDILPRLQSSLCQLWRGKHCRGSENAERVTKDFSLEHRSNYNLWRDGQPRHKLYQVYTQFLKLVREAALSSNLDVETSLFVDFIKRGGEPQRRALQWEGYVG